MDKHLRALKNRKTQMAIAVFIGLSVLIVVGSFYIKSFEKGSSSPSSSTPPQPTRQEMESNIKKDIESSLSPSAKRKTIIASYNDAASEQDTSKKYTKFVKTYQLLLKEYNNSKDTEVATAVYEMYNYLGSFPNAKKEDLPLAKI